MSRLIFKFDESPRREKTYSASQKSSLYIPMADGTKIAAEVIMPAGASNETRFPTILVQTRYWRAFLFRQPVRWFLGDQPPMVKKIIDEVVCYGAAAVYVDVRGTGASTGKWKNANTAGEFNDCNEIMDWIVKQPWSDGNIITWGISYLGLTAEFAAMHSHPALKGVMPMHDYWDVLADVAGPGGVPNTRFLELWSALGRSLDRHSPKALARLNPLIQFAVKHVKPVDEDTDGQMIAEAREAHRENVYPFDLVTKVKYMDDPIDEEGTRIASMSVHNYMKDIDRAGVPYYYWASWLDAGTADGAFNRFLNISNRQRVVIGDWNHGAFSRSNQFFPSKKKVVPSTEEQHVEWMNYFDRCLAGDVPDEKVIYYYTLVEEKWKKTTAWPPENHEMQAWYFSKGNSLARESPVDDAGEDSYAVDFSATTGRFNRWGAGLGYHIKYPERSREDKKLLTYTSHPLLEDMEITGNAILTIHVSSTHEDGMIIAYLEDVDEAGRVTYITEGELRLIHRKPAGPAALPYETRMQFHSYLRKDGMPMKQGEIAEIKIGLLSTSVLVRKGHSIRVAVAGADKDSFARIPAEGNPSLTVFRNKVHPSSIQLPVIPR